METIETQEDLEQNTLEIAQNSGLSSQIQDIVREEGLLTFESQTDIPISPAKLERSEYGVTLEDEDTRYKIDGFKEMINEPETALEFPILLTGTSTGKEIRLENLNFLYTGIDSLKYNNQDDDINLTKNAVKLAKDSGKNVFVFCHTHPKITEEQKKDTLSTRISDEIKLKYGIREVGLNISFGDLHKLAFLQEKGAEVYGIPEDSKIFLGVLMFNGEMYAISIEDDKFKATEIIYS